MLIDFTGHAVNVWEMAYIYTQAQDRRIVFDESCCDKILKTLEKYLKKTFAEYQNNITYHEFSPTLLFTSKDEYEECKKFIEFFKGYEDKPLEKLGNIFRKCADFCSIQ